MISAPSKRPRASSPAARRWLAQPLVCFLRCCLVWPIICLHTLTAWAQPPDDSGSSVERPRKIVILAGKKSHGPEGNGIHEYPRSARLLKAMIEQSGYLRGKVVTEIHYDGWPADASTLDDADTIMTISDGQDGDKYSPVPWMTADRMEIMRRQMRRGCGFMTFHFSTFAPDQEGREVLEWGGGYFDWQDDSGQRNWYSAIKTLDTHVRMGTATHPIARGLPPRFPLRDEFYYKIRFRDEDPRLVPLMLVPDLDGPPREHTVAWAVQREDGGRGFGTTCGHFYDNWTNPYFRKLILNAIAWTAQVAVPETGIEAAYLQDADVTRLLEVADEEPIRTLILTGHNHPAHQWRETTLALEDALRKDPRLHVVSMPNPEFLASPKLHTFDTVVLNYANWQQPGLSDEAKANFLKYLEAGGGLVIVHFSNGAFHFSLPEVGEASDWPEYRKICRRVWNHQPSEATGKSSGHDAYGNFQVEIQDAEHPITRGLRNFETRDELYYRQDGREPIHVLATAHSKDTQQDEPMAFVYRYGESRVFQTVLGHAAESLQTASTAAMIRRAAAWCASREPLVLEGDTSAEGPNAAGQGAAGEKKKAADGPDNASRPATRVEGRFGQAFNAKAGRVLAAARPPFSQQPLTAECWVNLPDAKQYNILLASESKASAQHWELFTQPGSGMLTAYLPGMQPDHVRSTAAICDGRWHYAALTHADGEVRLFVDGAEVARQQVAWRDPAEARKITKEGFAIGGLVEGGLGCRGALDEVRISRARRDISRVPDEPFAVDAQTVALWRFDELFDAGFPDEVAAGGAAQLAGRTERAAPKSAAEKDRSHWDAEAVGFEWSDTEAVDGRWNETDIGPFLASVLPLPAGPVAKGLTIQVSGRGPTAGQRPASVAYDLQTITFRAAWTDGFLRFDPARYGIARSPLVEGQLQLDFAPDTGFAGHRVQYGGLFQHGELVTLTYSVDEVQVLEYPAVQYVARSGPGEDGAGGRAAEQLPVFERHLQIASHPGTLSLKLDDAVDKLERPDPSKPLFVASTRGPRPRSFAIQSSDPTAVVSQRGGDLLVELPASDEPAGLQIAMLPAVLPSAEILKVVDRMRSSAPLPESLAQRTQPGPALWTETITTRGTRAADEAPYVIDTLTIPFENPYRALMFLGGFDFFSNGDIAVCTLHGDVWRVSGVDDDLQQLTWKRFATGLHQALGVRIVEDRVYVLGRDQITRLHDRDGDGEADFYECFNNEGKTSTGGHDYAGCLETDPAGNFYYIRAHEGVIRVSPDGQRHESLAEGLRNPIALSVGPDGTITASPQEGEWTPASAIFQIDSDGYYGYGGPRVTADRPLGYDPPLCWIPRLVDNSTGGQVWVTSERWGPLSGQLLSLSFGRCWPMLVLRERVAETMQGGTVVLPLNFKSGVIRGRFHPDDGQLYVCGLRGWVTAAQQDGCLQRVRYTGQPVHLPLAAEVLQNGMRLTFSEPVDPSVAGDVGNYAAQRWNYRYGQQYGSPEYRVSDPEVEGRDEVPLKSARVSPDGRSVFLEIPSMKPCMQLALSYQLRSAAGASFDDTLNYTVHAIPDRRGVPAEGSSAPRPGQLAAEIEARLVPGVHWSFRTLPSDSNVHDASGRLTQPEDERLGRLMAFHCSAAEPPSPLLRVGAFEAQADTRLRVNLNTQVRFAWHGNVRGELYVNGKRVLAALQPSTDSPTVSDGVMLHQGYNRIECRWRSSPEGQATFRLEWSGKDFSWETLPPGQLWSDPQSSSLQKAIQLRAGRTLFAEHRCAACHLPHGVDQDELDDLAGTMPELTVEPPDLQRVGDRLRPDWMVDWLLSPHSQRSDARMPSLFEPEDPAERQAAADVVAFLAGLGTPDQRRQDAVASEPTEEEIEQGEALYEQFGCLACHRATPTNEEDPWDRVSLGHVERKFRPGQLATFLRNPGEHHPSTRMPDFRLAADEARLLEGYLRSLSANGNASRADSPQGDAQRGAVLFRSRGCQQCHGAVPRTQAGSSHGAPRLASIFERTSSADTRPGRPSCLNGGGNLAQEISAPNYALTQSERQALERLLESDGTSLLRRSHSESAERLFSANRCNACHAQDDQSGQLPAVLFEEGNSGHPPERVPALTWAGEKLHAEWLERKIAGREATPLRPWLTIRMPGFPSHTADVLADGLAAQHGIAARAPRVPSPVDPELAELGRRLTQKQQGLDCRLCHALGSEDLKLDNKAQGIGLSLIAERVRSDYYHRWMLNPLRIDPQTAMPRFAPDGRTTKVEGILEGQAERQFDAIWHYLRSLQTPAAHGE